MTTQYEISILRLSSYIKSKVTSIAKRHKILESVIYNDLDVLLSESSEHFAEKGLETLSVKNVGEDNGNI